MDKKWEDAVIRAAAEASRLQPLATGLFVIALLAVLGNGVVEPLIDAARGEEFGEDFGRGGAVFRIAENLLHVAPAIALIWALWDARTYLGRLARGEVWGPATMQMLGNVGNALLWAGILALAVAPTLESWVHGGFDIDVRMEPTNIAMVGLGLLLSLIGRVVRNVVEVAAALKQENDEIV
jgi:hypothetical protein